MALDQNPQISSWKLLIYRSAYAVLGEFTSRDGNNSFHLDFIFLQIMFACLHLFNASPTETQFKPVFSLIFLQHVLLSLQSGKNFNYPRFEFWPFDSENEKKSTISLKNIVKLEITDHSIGSGGQVVSRVRVLGSILATSKLVYKNLLFLRKCYGKEWRNNSYNCYALQA